MGRAPRARFSLPRLRGRGREGACLALQRPPPPPRAAPPPPPRLGVTRFPRILDLGTGTGVLAIAAAGAFRRRVLASDIDPDAVRIARDNARFNRSAPLMRVCRANGLAGADIRAGAPFDLVFANILLASLQKLAAPLTGLVAPRGRVVLSGLLKAQANAARAAYPRFILERRIVVDGWATLMLRRSAALPFQASKK
jgi:ribosomal protein L11 methyltransferase